MSHRKRYATVVPIIFLFLVMISTPGQAQGNMGRHRMINLYSKGLRPQTLTIKTGTPVVWQSHLAHTKNVVVTVTFLKGNTVAQATQPVEGMNGFVLEDGQFVGRMEGNGGTVALTFTTPGEYTYALGHGDGLTGTILVRQ
jgi:plastocyanin